MVSRSTARIKPIETGDNILVPVPEFDRGRGDPANLLGVILDNGVDGFRGGTKVGILSRWEISQKPVRTNYLQNENCDKPQRVKMNVTRFRY
ncbi:hypothetical protein BaRGS_00009716 [Batillaria attramentaria]|uniref:Uncharacterized protein n=1 Tax=Batillaria attramentaria TaxID=370345 RepID=A0ABD0LI47_9CAEN